ncbi:MAG: YggT family protein [Methyloversatilis sp.]|jgi:YggT family protein|nr:YggT family protein [Methyloversatilis sp.]MBP6195355.1 YggT family protein [Methyloversatilis sp.]MBP9118742.1 YggT family protein [Methyloversatilis sp.]
MLTDLTLLVLNAVASFITTLLLARFYMQWARVSFRNQLGQFVIQTTDWAVMPARRIVPAMFGLDMATFTVAWLIQVLLVLIAAFLHGSFGADNLIVLALARGLIEVARLSVWFLIIALLISAVLSWVSPGNPLGGMLGALTRPFLQPIQRVMPPIANVDLSPLVLIVLLQIVLYLIDAAARQLFSIVS